MAHIALNITRPFENTRLTRIAIVAYWTLSLFGYVLLIQAATLAGIPGRWITVPARGAILFLSGYLLLVEGKVRHPALMGAVVAFWAAYAVRIVHDSVARPDLFAEVSVAYYILMAGGHCVSMLAVLSVTPDRTTLKWILNSVLLSAAGAGLIIVYAQRNVIGQDFGRLSNVYEDHTINALIMGYVGASLQALGVYVLLSRHFEGATRLLIGVLVACAGVLPFFFGASRGAVLATAVCIMFALGANISLSRLKLRPAILGLVIVSLVPLAVWGAELVGSNVFERFSGLTESVSSGDSSSARLALWRSAVVNIARSPLVGHSFLFEADLHVHNLFLDALMSLGILGGLFVAALSALALYKSWWMLRFDFDSAGWIALLFLVYFTASLFSGGIYGNSQLWCLIAAVVAVGGQQHAIIYTDPGEDV